MTQQSARERYFDGRMKLDVIERDQRCAEPVFIGALGTGMHEPDHTPKATISYRKKAYAPLPESIELLFVLDHSHQGRT